MESGIQPVMNVGGYGCNDGYGFGGSGIWLFAILALMWGGFGGNRFGNAFEGRCATVEDLNNSANFTRLENQVQGNGTAITTAATNLGNGICQLGYQLATDFGNLEKDLADCCCGINRNIDAVRYENAMNTAAINANTTAGIQKVLDRLCEDKLAAQQARISQLELNQALCGVVRYPTSATFNAGFPFLFNGFNCGCNGFNGNI